MKYAASLLMRRGAEVYWVRRRDDLPFLSGFHAFPGGLVQAGDGDVGADPDAACRRAALRETLEETGADLGVRLDALRPVGRWRAPPYLVIALETRFYTVETGADPRVAANNSELAHGEWIHPAAALERWHAGLVLLAPPTFTLLRRLAAGALCDDEAEAPSFSPVRPHIDLFPVRTPTLPPATHTNCYVVGDARLAVFDPASPYPDERARLDAYLDARIAGGATVECLVLTHHHFDHVAGAVHLAERLGVPIWAHPETASRVDIPIARALREGDTIDLGAHVLEMVHTPGHAPGHLVFFDRATRSAVVGDMVAGIGSILVEPGDGDMSAYLDSLDRMRGLGLSCLMPAHGPVIGGAVAKLTEYIDHRNSRERQAVAALEQGAAGIRELVDRVYVDVPAMMKAGPQGGAAGASLRSHLDKLAREGRASLSGDVWRLTTSPSAG